MSEFSVVRTSSYTELNIATLSAVNATITNAMITNATITNATIDFLTINLTILNDLTVDGVIQVSDGTEGTPSYTFTSDPDTGMYRPANNQLGFSTGGTLRADISSAGISVQGGTAAIPSINFGLAGGDIDTGMFRAGANTLGLSVNGIQTATIVSAPAPLGMTPGLNVGTTSNLFGLRRVSSSGHSWEDGNCGNSEFIVFTASDFMSFTDTSTRTATFVTWSTATASRSPVVNNNVDAGPALACKLIPKGFIISEGKLCFIYTDTATIGLVPQQMDIDVRAQTAAGPTIELAHQLVTTTIPAGGAGWQTAGDGSVNTPDIQITFGSAAAKEAATGTGFNTINVHITPMMPMNSTNGGIVAFKVPITRI